MDILDCECTIYAMQNFSVEELTAKLESSLFYT